MRGRGFSLLELMAVLLIMAIVAAAVTLRMQGPLRQSQTAEVIDRIRAFDEITRTYARQQDQTLQVMVDMSANKLGRTNSAGQAVGAGLELPKGCSFNSVSLATDRAHGGKALLVCGNTGYTPTYCLEVQDAQRQRHWLLFAGLSGEMKVYESQNAAQQVLAALSGSDAR